MAADTTVIPTKVGLAMLVTYWMIVLGVLAMARIYPSGFPPSVPVDEVSQPLSSVSRNVLG